MSDVKELGSEILEHLRFYREMGVGLVAAGLQAPALTRRRPSGHDEPSAQAAASGPGNRMSHPRVRVSAPAAGLFDGPPPEREELEEIRADLGDCRRCKLAPGRTNIVFGAGNPRAELMFVGEAPGADEDRQGLPFVGLAGRLLTKIIEAIDMRREDVYICNILKCRPPGNRNPESEEIAACSPFLFRQIASVEPKVICALGTFGAQTLLRTREPISRLRGHFIDFRGAKFMATFHPAYLLRNPQEKRKVWEDVKKIRDYLRSLREQ